MRISVPPPCMWRDLSVEFILIWEVMVKSNSTWMNPRSSACDIQKKARDRDLHLFYGKVSEPCACLFLLLDVMFEGIENVLSRVIHTQVTKLRPSLRLLRRTKLNWLKTFQSAKSISHHTIKFFTSGDCIAVTHYSTNVSSIERKMPQPWTDSR